MGAGGDRADADRTVTSDPEPTAAPSHAVAARSPSPGADAVFDATTALALFVTPADLVADVPAAEPEVRQLITSGQLPWGLPLGLDGRPAGVHSSRSPSSRRRPPWYDALIWGNDALAFQQEVVLLPDPAAAREAFRELVTTVDACPEYSQVNPGIDGATWTAEPAIEGQGVYPSIVQEVTHSAEGSRDPRVPGPPARRQHHRHVDRGGARRGRPATRRWPPWATRPDLSAMVQEPRAVGGPGARLTQSTYAGPRAR